MQETMDAVLLVEDKEAVEAQFFGKGDTFEVVSLHPVAHDDTRVYTRFTHDYCFDPDYHNGITAYGADGKILPLPHLIKGYYQHVESSEAVWQLLNVFAVGKTIGECNRLVSKFLEMRGKDNL